VIGTNGFYVDFTFPPEEREAFISDAVAEIAANRAVIEQVKRVLMMVYRIDADAAFDLLKWRSQEANIKLRALAEQLLSDFRALNYDDTLPARAMFDHLLLTVHNRVRPDGVTAPSTPG
jgi:MoxR-like ATPase